MTDSPTARRPFLIATALLVLLPFGSAPVAAETGVRLDGPRVQGGLLRGRVPPGSTVEYEGDAVRVSQDGWFLVGFGRDAPPEAELAVVYPDGRSERQVLKVEGRKYNIQRIDGLPPSKVTPSEEDLVRIRAEVKMVKKVASITPAHHRPMRLSPNPRPPPLQPCPDCARGCTPSPLRLASRALRSPAPSRHAFLFAGSKSRHLDRDSCDSSALVPMSNPTTTGPILPQPSQSTPYSSYPP